MIVASAGLFGRLDALSGHWWFLAVIALIAYLDSVIPVVPSETCVIIGGVAAGIGRYPVLAVIATGAVGAFLGDTTAYALGHRAGPWLERRAVHKPKTKARMEWAKAQIHERGGMLLITARFIPGGRTALTLSSGITRQPRSWFFGWVAGAVVIWASYAALLGYVGGRAFADDHTRAFLVAFAGAVTLTLLIEVARYVRKSRRSARVAVAAE